MCELAHGAQGLDALEKWGGSIQELPVTGVLDSTAVESDLGFGEAAVSVCLKTTQVSDWACL